jgi:hypothetical protein
MPDPAPSVDLLAEADAVIRRFGLPLQPGNLELIAAELERRVHIFDGGWVLAMRIVGEIRRRAQALRAARPGEPRQIRS